MSQIQYPQRDILALERAGGYYSRHVRAMTTEKLDGKSQIAEQLAWRDAEIDHLRRALIEIAEGETAPADMVLIASRAIGSNAPHEGAGVVVDAPLLRAIIRVLERDQDGAWYGNALRQLMAGKPLEETPPGIDRKAGYTIQDAWKDSARWHTIAERFHRAKTSACRRVLGDLGMNVERAHEPLENAVDEAAEEDGE